MEGLRVQEAASLYSFSCPSWRLRGFVVCSSDTFADQVVLAAAKPIAGQDRMYRGAGGRVHGEASSVPGFLKFAV